MTAEQSSTAKLWLYFFISLVICVGLLVVSPEFFWVPLPFVITYLVQALRML